LKYAPFNLDSTTIDVTVR